VEKNANAPQVLSTTNVTFWAERDATKKLWDPEDRKKPDRVEVHKERSNSEKGTRNSKSGQQKNTVKKQLVEPTSGL